MKFCLFVIYALLSLNTFAFNYCGSLNSLTMDYDIYYVERMSLYNGKEKYKTITIKDKAAMLLIASILTDNPAFNTKDNWINWYWQDSKDRYFICVKGSEIRNYQANYFMDQVTDIRVWKNGEEI